MTITEISDRKKWVELFNASGSPSFHQSWEWGELEQHQKYSVRRFSVTSHSGVEAIFQIILISSKRARFIFVPHGPVCLRPNSKQQTEIMKTVHNFLVTMAGKEQCSFIRIAPIFTDSTDNRRIFTDFGYRTAPIYMHAETMWELDITPSEEELLAGMRKTTRYLIRKGIKEGIRIEKRSDLKVIDDFWNLYQETYTREDFVPFSKEFIGAEYDIFSKNNNAVFLFGFKQENTPQVLSRKFDASALILFTPSTAFYHQGASIHSKHPVPYVLQWEAVREAKRRGCKRYNFYGIYKKGRTPRAWAGLTLFKQGFGGYEVNYVPTQDYVLSPKYYLNYLYEKYLTFRRGV